MKVKGNFFWKVLRTYSCSFRFTARLYMEIYASGYWSFLRRRCSYLLSIMNLSVSTIAL
jgi:hypothetical protein